MIDFLTQISIVFLSEIISTQPKRWLSKKHDDHDFSSPNYDDFVNMKSEYGKLKTYDEQEILKSKQKIPRNKCVTSSTTDIILTRIDLETCVFNWFWETNRWATVVAILKSTIELLNTSLNKMTTDGAVKVWKRAIGWLTSDLVTILFNFIITKFTLMVC